MQLHKLTMPTSEKFCLKWNDFRENINTAFIDLRKDSDFTDVTLACEDGHQVDTHKLILAASSPFFQNMLKRNKHAHPLIYMRGMKSEDLIAIVDFLYYGEANIYQENLDAFLKIAEELQLKGLNGTEDRGETETKKPSLPMTDTQGKTDLFESNILIQNNSLFSQSYSKDNITSSMTVALPKLEFSGELSELDGKIETMMVRSETMVRGPNKNMIKAFVCQVCGKEGQKTNIKDHIEANHLEGISIPCSLCEKTFRSRNAFRQHAPCRTTSK